MPLAQEALGDDLEDIHAALSRRGAMRKSLSSSRLNMVPKTNGRTSDASKDSEGEERRLRSHGQLRDKQYSSSQLLEEESDSRNAVFGEEDRRHRRRSDRRRSSRVDGSDGGKFNRSDSAIEKLLEYNEAGNYSVGSNESFAKTKKKSKSSMNPLLIGLSKSRDSSAAGVAKKSEKKEERRRRSSKSRERRRSSKSRERGTSSTRTGLRKGKQRDRSSSVRRSSSRSTRMKKIDDREDSPRTRQRVRRRGSSSSHHVHNKGKSSDKLTRGVKSLRATRSFMSRDELRKENGIPKDAFEKLWGEKDSAKDELNHSHNSTNNSTQSNSVESSCASPKDTSSSKLESLTPKAKKTKLEKIHELQGQCDIFKIELDAMTAERDKLKNELKEGHKEVSSLKKLVDVHEGQTAKLKLNLARAEEELESTRMEQRTERTDFSDAAKELAKVNIEYAKSVDEARLLKEELAGIQGKLSEREEKVLNLEKELNASNENVEHLEADLLYADDQIRKLEKEIKKLEEEVALYSEAAGRDGDGEDDGANLREAKFEAERRKCEQREKEIDENAKKIDEKIRMFEEEMKEFERQKGQYLEERQMKEKEFEEKRAKAEEERLRKEEELNQSGEDRLKKEDEINERLNELKNENTALNGRLKSEQLESTMKLQNKENIISELQAEVARLAKEQQRRDSAPDSSPALLVEIDSLKTEATRRNSDFEDIRMKKAELEDEIEGLQNINVEVQKRLSDIELEVMEHKKEAENQKRKTLEWQKKTGEWSEKAVVWKQRAEHWEKKAKESNSDNASSASDEAAIEPQALFLAAAVEKRAANMSAANANGSWRLGRRIFGMSSVDSEDEAQALISKLEGENLLKEQEIKTLKSEMVKMQTSYKEQAYSKTQACEKLRKEMEAIELKNVNLMNELELARKLNKTISESAL